MRSALILFFIGVVFLSTVRAEVVDLSVSPENPVRGDMVTVYGTASPNEEVRVDVSFEKVVPVQNGEYLFTIDDVVIPEGKNRFTVTAYGANDLKVSVRLFFNLIWVTLGSEASNGVATVTQGNVPPGTYDVQIHGKSSQNSVRLKITATGYIKADGEGRFSYSYKTSSMPLGDFVIKAGGVSKVVTLSEYAGSLGSSSSSSTSGSGGGGGSTLPASSTTPAPTPTLTSTPVPTETPAVMLMPNATVTVSMSAPELTPTRSPQPASTQIPADFEKNSSLSVDENVTTPVETKPVQKIIVGVPGFAIVAGIASLIIAASLNRRVRG
jgi:hypothetical protein